MAEKVTEVRAGSGAADLSKRDTVVIRIVPEPFVPGERMADDDLRAAEDARAVFDALYGSLGGHTFGLLREHFRAAEGYGQVPR